MADCTDPEINGLLSRSGILSAHRKTTFVGRRGSKKVRVHIFDGTNNANPTQRYYAIATSEDGKTATGNNAPSVKEALESLAAHLTALD
jgi:hypothetical protein